MSRTSKVFTGMLSIIPLILVAAIFIQTIFRFTRFSRGETEPSLLFDSPSNFFLIAAALFLFSIGLLVFFIVNVSRNKKMDSTERAIWILVFVLGGIISYPIYWYLKIWKEDL